MNCIQAVVNHAVERSNTLCTKRYYDKKALLTILHENKNGLRVQRTTRKHIWQLRIWNFYRQKFINRYTKMRQPSTEIWPSILCGNLRSIKNKFDEVHETVIQHNCDVNIFTETWLSDSYHSDLLAIPGYTNKRLDRNSQKGGGIIVYLREETSFQIVDFDNPNRREILPIFLHKSNHLLISIYHPFWQEEHVHEESVDILFNIISKTRSTSNNALKVTIIGDFNGLRACMEPVCKSFNLRNFVNFPTRGSSTLDCCYSSKSAQYTCTRLSPVGQSDHNIFTCRSQPKRRKLPFKHVLVPDYSPRNKSLFLSLLYSSGIENTSPIHSVSSLNFTFDSLIAIIASLIEFCFPVKKIKVYEHLPWINHNIRHLIRQRNNACRRNNKSVHKHYRTKVKVAIQNAKKKYATTINNLSSKESWDKIKQITNVSRKSSYTATSFSSEQLLDFFTSITSEEDPNLQHDLSCSPESDHIHLSDELVLKCLQQSKKGGGVPYLPAWLLKSHSDILVKPLRIIFEASLNLGVIPRHLKVARVTPIPKIKTPLSVSDFRPITCVSPILKALEKVVLHIWLKPLINERTFHDQYAFVPLKGRGCASALSVIYGHLVQAFDNGFYCNLLMIDFSKAFDRVSSFKIVDNLISLGASQQCIFWVFNFLQDRLVQVSQGNEKSSFRTISGGTPQGSIISPVLFAIACHSLTPTTNSCLYVKYADDLTVIHAYKNSPSDLQSEINSISNWSTTNGLLINESKTKLMHISGRKSPKPPLVTVNSRPIDIVSTACLLGLTFTNDLKWNSNTITSINKASKLFYHIVLLKRCNIHPKVLYAIYCSIIRSILTYSCPATINMSQKCRRSLEKCEKRFLMVIGYSPPERISAFIIRLCKSFVQSVCNNHDHPFRKLLIKVDRSRTRSERTLVAPNSRSSLKKNSIISYFK